MKTPFSISVLAASFLTGCAVGPDYHRPTMPTSMSFRCFGLDHGPSFYLTDEDWEPFATSRRAGEASPPRLFCSYCASNRAPADTS